MTCRTFLTAALLLLSPLPSLADTVRLAAPVTAVTLYPDVAQMVRRTSVDLPAGRHRLILSDLPSDLPTEFLRVTLSGAVKGATSLHRESRPPAQRQDPPDVAAARTDVTAAEDALQAQRDQAAEARLVAQAAETRLQFLAGLGRTEGAANADEPRLRSLSALVGEEALAARRAAFAAEREARAAERALPDLEAALSHARDALAALEPDSAERLVLTLDVTKDTAGPVTLEATYFSQAGWRPAYDVHLTRGPSPTLEWKRRALIYQNSGEPWRDVALTLSTLQPSDQIAPSAIYPWLRRIEDREPPRTLGAMSDGVAEPVIEAPVIFEAAETLSAMTDGYTLVYTYDRPITIGQGRELALEMGGLTTDAEIAVRAVPRRDDTAFLVARMTNDTGEGLIPVPDIALFVDGDWVGVTNEFTGLEVGQEGEIPFGPVRGLQLDWTLVERSEGDRGLISRTNATAEKVRLEVQNLTGETWPLRVLDRVPYSEQEELVITWTASPAPSEENVRRRAGILAWDMEIAPGETREIFVETAITWPEGKELR